MSTVTDRSLAGNTLAIKAPVKVATTANVTLSATQTVDGVALVDGDRILVKNQSNAVQNGIFIVRASAWERAPDWDGAGDAVEGTWILIQQGTANAEKLFELTTSGTINIGVTELAFAERGVAPTLPLAQSSGGTGTTSLGVGTVTTTGGSSARSLVDHFSDILNVKDFGAVGDGTTNDTAAITAADDLGKFIYVPAGTYDTTLASTTLDGPYYGSGKIRDTSDNLRARYFSAIKAAPSSLGTYSSVETYFNGDWSKSQFPIEHRITGAATLGQPTSGYLYTPEAYPHFTYLYNSSGHNESTSTNTGRTAAVAYRTAVYNAGQGDCVAYNATAFVTGTKASSTSFLANPAASLFNGDMTAGEAGVYLNARELVLDDAGFDVAAIGDVVRLDRNNVTGAKNVWWQGYRIQSEGAEEIDVGFSLSGPAQIGLDFSFATLATSGTYTRAAITMKADQRIYLNATATDASGLNRFPSATGTDYIFYSSSLSAFNFVVNNASALQIYTNQVVCPVPLNVASGQEYRFNGTKVVGARDTGWTAMTGTANENTAYDTASITLPQLAGRVMALQVALTTHGLIGA